MKRCIAPICAAVAVALLGLASTAGAAAVDEYEEQKKKSAEASISKEGAPAKKLPWRNSLLAYSHNFSALSLAKGADLSYNPYYSQSLMFLPRYYLRDDLTLRARLDLEIELTDSDSTTTSREWVVSDLSLELNYAPTWMVIPVAKVMVNPSVRLYFPTSIVSRSRTMMMGLAPGFAMRRSFDLLKGRWLPRIGVSYGFRFTKYFNEYATAQISKDVCSITPDPDSPTDPGCVSSGAQNKSWRFVNSLGFQLTVMDKLSVSGNMLFINNLLYGLDDTVAFTPEGTPVVVPATEMNHTAALWFTLGASYDLFDWVSLSAGVSTYHSQLAEDSTIRTPFFNRYTAFTFDATIPVDKFVSQVQTWTGWGR